MAKKLSFDNFSQRRAQGEMVLSLVGMSNVGKSFWAEQLGSVGFDVICCDDGIKDLLAPKLLGRGGKGGISTVANWMGQPYDERFASTQKQYLDLEEVVTSRALGCIEDGGSRNVVVDTTGSVVHLDHALRRRMCDLTTVVYLEAGEKMLDRMYQLYTERPKPVVWGDLYNPREGEGREESLRRLYPELLGHRAERYREMADAVVPVEDTGHLRDGEDFLEYVKYYLERRAKSR